MNSAISMRTAFQEDSFEEFLKCHRNEPLVGMLKYIYQRGKVQKCREYFEQTTKYNFKNNYPGSFWPPGLSITCRL